MKPNNKGSVHSLVSAPVPGGGLGCVEGSHLYLYLLWESWLYVVLCL